jgi:hypothetical protein
VTSTARTPTFRAPSLPKVRNAKCFLHRLRRELFGALRGIRESRPEYSPVLLLQWRLGTNTSEGPGRIHYSRARLASKRLGTPCLHFIMSPAFHSLRASDKDQLRGHEFEAETLLRDSDADGGAVE